jgi:RNA polymerase sigma factor (sigma-70 family)
VARKRVSSAVTLPPFQVLLDAHAGDLHRLLVGMVGRHDADDCYQETWLAALRAYPRLRDAANLRGWLLTIAHRKAIDLIRAERKTAVSVAEIPEAGQPAAGGPESLLSRDDALWAHVRELPTKQRTALALRFLTDAPYAEISAVMEISEDAARRNVHEGLKRLRTEYKP